MKNPTNPPIDARIPFAENVHISDIAAPNGMLDFIIIYITLPISKSSITRAAIIVYFRAAVILFFFEIHRFVLLHTTSFFVKLNHFL